jgi:hypothetical protein
LSISYRWKITPTGISVKGEKLITRLIYNLTATDEDGATGELGAPGIAYLPKAIPADGVTAATLTTVLSQILGPDNIAVYKRITENNLASFKLEPMTGDC